MKKNKIENLINNDLAPSLSNNQSDTETDNDESNY